MVKKFKIKSIISDWCDFPDVTYETIDVALIALLNICEQCGVSIYPVNHHTRSAKVILEGEPANIRKAQTKFIIECGDEFTFNEVWL